MSCVNEYLNYQQQYEKKYGPQTIVLYAKGSFFEIYGVDNKTEKIGRAAEMSDLLNVQLTRENKGIIENSRSNALMVGIPVVALDKYLRILIQAQYTVVLVEQTTLPPSPKREVTRIISPGTVLEETNPDANDVISLYMEKINNNALTSKWLIGLSSIDITTGHSCVYEVQVSGDLMNDDLKPLDEAYRFIHASQPREIVINIIDNNTTPKEIEKLLAYLELFNISSHVNCNSVEKEMHKVSYQNKFLKKIYSPNTIITPIEYIGLEKKPTGLMSFMVLLQFIYEHNELVIQKIKIPTIWESSHQLVIDYNSIIQLNILPNAESSKAISSSKNSVFSIIKHTETSMGYRLLKERLSCPIIDEMELNRRYDLIEACQTCQITSFGQSSLSIQISKSYFDILAPILRKIKDIERLQRKMSLCKLNPADFVILDTSYQAILELIDQVKCNDLLNKLITFDVDQFNQFRQKYLSIFDLNIMMTMNLNDITRSFFKSGVYPDLDELQQELTKCSNYLPELASYLSVLIRQEENRGDDLVKVSQNAQTGYYISLTNRRYDILAKYLPKELANTFTIRQLNKETRIYSSNIEKCSNSMIELEVAIGRKTTEYYIATLKQFSDTYLSLLQKITSFISEIDVIQSCAKVATIYKYCRPKIEMNPLNNSSNISNNSLSFNHQSFLIATEMRHPLIEQILTDEFFVPNNIALGAEINTSATTTATTIDGILLYGLNFSGKCLGYDTKILMYNGTIKNVQDIQIGDIIMGDDSTPRQILNTVRGSGTLYKITQANGNSYVVNGDHILSLKSSSYHHKTWDPTDNRFRVFWFQDHQHKSKSFTVKNEQKKRQYSSNFQTKELAEKAADEFLKTVEKDEQGKIIDISVNDYLAKPATWQRNYYGYKVGVEFSAQPILLDPYILGYWLGDGTSSRNDITTAEPEVVDYFRKYATYLSLEFKQIKDAGVAKTYRFINLNSKVEDKDIKYDNCQSCGDKINTKNRKYCSNKCHIIAMRRSNFMNYLLHLYNLLDNKHIPKAYKYNSREIRLNVLAGLMDSDGSLDARFINMYDITLKSERLLDDVIYLARSLGFSCEKHPCLKTCTNAPEGPKTGLYYRTSISGNVEEIPTKVSRKQGIPIERGRYSWLITGFNVTNIGVGDYYGFQTDGNHRFLLEDFTVTHNSSTMLMVGVNVILAQAGMFIAAKEFKYRPYTQILTRLTPDTTNIFQNRSSFLLEISELKSILIRANNRSLVLGDEICRSTENYSALAIVASSIMELSKKKANFIFATHLHQLDEMKQIKNLSNVKSFYLHVDRDLKTNKLVFTRKLLEGSGPSIYGIEVCYAVGLSQDFIDNAISIRREITGESNTVIKIKSSRYNSNVYINKCEICGDKAVDTHHILAQKDADCYNHTPIGIHKNNESNLVELCKQCHLDSHNGKIAIEGYKITSEGKILQYKKTSN